jgi:hypothetical protein
MCRRFGARTEAWNSDPRPFAWTATAEEIFAKVRLVQTRVRQLADNNCTGHR